MWYTEEIIFNGITYAIICIDTAVTLPSSTLNFYQGEFVLCVYTIYSKYYDYNIERFFVVKVRKEEFGELSMLKCFP